MKEFKYIMTENLKEFKEFYTEEVKNLAPKFAQNALPDISKTILDFSSGKQMKSNNQLAFEVVERLNQEIFENAIEEIKQMMTVAIMET